MNLGNATLDRTQCPLCGVFVEPLHMFQHMFNYHEEFLMILMAVNNPLAAEQLFFEEDDSYETLSSLCDRVGNHTVETDPDTVSTVLTKECSTTCPICLENISVIVSDDPSYNIRQLNACKHLFCDPCITTWLKQSKLCPVCKNDSTSDQIKLISDSLNSIKSSLSPTVAPLSD